MIDHGIRDDYLLLNIKPHGPCAGDLTISAGSLARFILAVQRHMGPGHEPERQGDLTDKPAPNADEPTSARIIAGIVSTYPPFDTQHPTAALPLAANIVSAIRGGKVPGIRSDDARDKEVQSLRGQAARWSLESAIVKQIISGEELSGSDSDYETEITEAVQRVVKERDELKKRVEELKKLWDAERERADEAEREHVACGNVLKEQIAHVNRLTEENERLRKFWKCFKPDPSNPPKNNERWLTEIWEAAKPKGEM